MENRKLKPKKVYIRTCVHCGDKKEVKSFREADRDSCQDCNQKNLGYKMSQRNIKDDTDKVKYMSICPQCGIERDVKSKVRIGCLCGTCSRSNIGKANAGKVRAKPKVIKKPKPKVVKAIKKPKPRKTKSDYINPLVLEKVREKNRQHRENEKIVKKVKVRNIEEEEQFMQDSINKWMLFNQVTKIPEYEQPKDSSGQKMYIGG